MASRPTRHKVNLETARMCVTHKVCLPTYEAALDAAERLMRMDIVKPGCHITPYVCNQCGRWHVRNRVIVPIPGVNVPNKRVPK